MAETTPLGPILPIPAAKREGIHRRLDKCLPELVASLGPTAKANKDDVETAIIATAEDYVWLTSAPSVKQTRCRLENIRRAAAKLAKQLSELDPAGAVALNRAGLWTLDEPQTLRDLLRNPATKQLSVRIRALAAAAERGLSTLPAKDQNQEGRKLWEEPAKRGLVIDCLMIFDYCRPDEADTGRSGDFRAFVDSVFSVATGEEPSGYYSLETPVKQVLKKWKNRKRRGLSGHDLWASL